MCYLNQLHLKISLSCRIYGNMNQTQPDEFEIRKSKIQYFFISASLFLLRSTSRAILS